MARLYRIATYIMPSLPVQVSNVTCVHNTYGREEHADGLEWIEVHADKASTAKRMAARERVRLERERKAS